MRAVPFRPTRLARLRAALCCLLALWVLGWAQPVGAATAAERSVKAAFVLKFIGYTEFPHPASPVVVGVAGAPRLQAEMARLAAHGAGGVPVLVREVHPNDSLAGLQVLFIGGAETDRAERLLHAAARQGVLAVTEFDGGLREGSVINFRLVDERVRFEVSLAAADRAGIRLSSRLLSVAWLVEKPRD